MISIEGLGDTVRAHIYDRYLRRTEAELRDDLGERGFQLGMMVIAGSRQQNGGILETRNAFDGLQLSGNQGPIMLMGRFETLYDSNPTGWNRQVTDWRQEQHG